jgi:hypothetical protein
MILHYEFSEAALPEIWSHLRRPILPWLSMRASGGTAARRGKTLKPLPKKFVSTLPEVSRSRRKREKAC